MISDMIVDKLTTYLMPYTNQAYLVSMAIYLLAFFFLVMFFLRKAHFDGFAQIVIIVLALTFLILDGLLELTVLLLPTTGVLIAYMLSGYGHQGGD